MSDHTPSVEFYESFRPGVPGDPGLKEWRWRLKAGNGKIVASGEGHRDKADAERAFRDMVGSVLALTSFAVGFAVAMGGLPGQEPK